MSGPFAKTSFGPPAPLGTDTNKGGLIADVQDGIVESVDNAGNTHGLASAFLILLAQTALTTITTAQNLISQAFLAQALNKKTRTLQITGALVYTSPGTTGITLTFVLKLGSVTLATVVLPTGNTAARTAAPIQFAFTVQVASTGASGTLEAHGSVTADLNAAAAADTTTCLDATTAVSSAVDLTAAETMTLSIACSGVTLTSATLRAAQIVIVN
jgi:hypothetical protein